MAVLMNVGQPLQAMDNIFMTEWVAIFRESGLRDDVSIADLQEACLKLVVLARAQARELHIGKLGELTIQHLPRLPCLPPSPG